MDDVTFAVVVVVVEKVVLLLEGMIEMVVQQNCHLVLAWPPFVAVEQVVNDLLVSGLYLKFAIYYSGDSMESKLIRLDCGNLGVALLGPIELAVVTAVVEG